MQSSHKAATVLLITSLAVLDNFVPIPVVAQTPSPAPSASAPARRSPLPDAALKLAQQAEQQLAANKADEAITVFRQLDKQYPNQPAISLRLAQINDTLNRNGYALFYYRRYMNQISKSGMEPRDIATERVVSLERMFGVNDAAEKAAHEMGETTVPVATPVPQIDHQLMTEAKDGSRVPIRNEQDFERLQRQGVPKTAPTTPAPTPQPAIVIPTQLSARNTPAPQKAVSKENVSKQPGTLQITSSSSDPKLTPHPPDEDAVLAGAFRKADSPGSVTELANSSAQQESGTVTPPADPGIVAASVPPQAISSPLAVTDSADERLPPRTNPARTAPPPPAVMFTKKEPLIESARATAFFNVMKGSSPIAEVALLNDLPDAVITFSLTPEDASEVISAILVPGEKRALAVPPARYDLSATVTTNDYSPITLMSSHFKYTFEAGRKYTRRYNKASLEQAD